MIALFCLSLLSVVAYADPSFNSTSMDYPPGMTTTVTQTGLTYAKDVALKLLTVVLNSLTIPDQHGNQDTLRYIVAGIKLSNVALPDASITLSNGSFFIQFTGVAGEISAAWWAREDIWPNPKGIGTVTAVWTGVTMNALLTFGASDGKPVVSTPYTLFHIADFKLRIEGRGLLAEVAQLLEWIFAREIKALIEQQVTAAMATGINVDLNKFIQTLPTVVPVGNTAAFNASLVPPNIALSPAALSINVRGMFIDTQNPNDRPPYTPTSIPQILSSTEMVQIFLGDWVPDSGAWIFTEQGKLTIVLTEALMQGSPLPFNTANWKTAAPGLFSTYPNLAMQAVLGPIPGYPPISIFEPTGITSYFSFGVNFTVIRGSTDVPVFTLGMNFTTSATITVGAGNVLVSQLSLLKIEVTVLNTLVGPIDVASANKELAYVGQSILLPYVNGFLAKGVPIPIFDGVQLVNTQVSYGNGWIGLLSNIEYEFDYEEMKMKEIQAEKDTTARREKLWAEE